MHCAFSPFVRNSAGQFARKRRPVEGPVPERRSFLTLHPDCVLKGGSPPFESRRSKKDAMPGDASHAFDKNFRQIRLAFYDCLNKHQIKLRLF